MPGKSVRPSRPPFLVPIAPTHFHWLLHLHLRAHPLFHENIIFQHPFPGQILKDLLSIPIFQIFRNRFFVFSTFPRAAPRVKWLEWTNHKLFCGASCDLWTILEQFPMLVKKSPKPSNTWAHYQMCQRQKNCWLKKKLQCLYCPHVEITNHSSQSNYGLFVCWFKNLLASPPGDKF